MLGLYIYNKKAVMKKVIFSLCVVAGGLFFISDTEPPAEEFKVPLGLPPVPWPADNAYTKKKADLGKLLYFDKRLSADGTVSCATCHNAPCGFSDCKAIAVGIKDHKGTRHSPAIINAAYQTSYFWDGRAATLEEQCKGPLGNPKEMTNVDDVHLAHRQCVERIKAIPGYQALFKEAFGHNEITIDEIAKAIATFERTILSGNSPYDKFVAGDHTALTKEQIQGFRVFRKANCNVCHEGFNFTDNAFQNIGIGTDVPNPDPGRYGIVPDSRFWAAFKTPTLREVEHSPPYMHDGSLATLEDVVDYYDKGGIPNKNLNPFVKPLNLTPEDKKALVAFMKALNGEGWQHFEEPAKFPE